MLRLHLQTQSDRVASGRNAPRPNAHAQPRSRVENQPAWRRTHASAALRLFAVGGLRVGFPDRIHAMTRWCRRKTRFAPALLCPAARHRGCHRASRIRRLRLRDLRAHSRWPSVYPPTLPASDLHHGAAHFRLLRSRRESRSCEPVHVRSIKRMPAIVVANARGREHVVRVFAREATHRHKNLFRRPGERECLRQNFLLRTARKTRIADRVPMVRDRASFARRRRKFCRYRAVRRRLRAHARRLQPGR